MTAPGYRIRPARTADLPALPAVEAEAVTMFDPHRTELGLSDESYVAASAEDFRTAQAAGRLWVAVDAGDRPVGFALVLEIDGLAHLDELDVLPEHGGKGLGSALLEAVCTWAGTSGYPAVTLSTFRDVPWNGPFYARRGFEVVDREQLSPGLARLVAGETRRGLRTDLRAIMRREI